MGPREILLVGLALIAASTAGSSREIAISETVQKAAAKQPASSIPWDRVPLCLQATASRDSSRQTATAIKWTSARHDVRTPKGAFGLQLADEEIVLTLDGRAVTVGADENGRPISLGDSAIAVWGVPDCDSPAYLFIEQRDAGSPVTIARWFFDPNRSWRDPELAVIEFPGKFGSDTVLSVRDKVLTIANDVAEATEKTFQYQPAPVFAFVQKGVPPKYLGTLNKPNGEFFENAAARDVVVKTAGQELFDDLRDRTSVGTTRLFGGRYLIVAGAASGDLGRHAALIVDLIGNAAFFVLCDDDPEETGRLVASSQEAAAAGTGDDVVGALESVGFSVRWNGDRLVCNGECHSER